LAAVSSAIRRQAEKRLALRGTADHCALQARAIQTRSVRSFERSRAALIGLTLWLGPRGPLAAQTPFELSWQAPAQCPSHADVSAALSRLAAAGSRLEDVRIEIERTGERWQARLSARGAQRRLEGESCGAVVDALTVVLALAAERAEQDAAAANMPSAAPAEPIAAPPSPAPEALESATTPEAPRPESKAAFHAGLRLGVLAELGMLPGPSLGPRIALELQRRRWSGELALAGLLPRHAELGGQGSPASDLHWLGGQLSLCRGPRLGFSFCLGAEAGRISGTGSGVDEPFDASGWWGAGSAGARYRGALSERQALFWLLELSAAAALFRPEFGFDDLGVLHRARPVSGRLFLGLGWH
jgi:hypothetical protein